MRLYVAFLSFCSCMACAPSWTFAVDARFAIDPDELSRKLSGKPAPSRAAEPAAPRKAPLPSARPVVRTSRKHADRSDTYVVRAGDNIMKILVRDYGMSDAAAEALVPEIKRLNGLEKIRSLRVGSTIRIPARRGDGAVATTVPPPRAGSKSAVAGESSSASHVMHLSSSAGSVSTSPDSNLDPVRRVWDRLVPAVADQGPLDVSGRNFSLSLDAAKFPVLPAADGGKIVVDPDGTLPVLVKSLLNDSKVRVVTEHPSNRRRLFSAVLSAAKFYSVEENFAVSFGSDPQLTVKADYKIEKSPDSVMRQDVVLLNTGENQKGMPANLIKFLGQEGFSVVEASLPGTGSGLRRDQLCMITDRNPRNIADSLLKALSVPYETDRAIDLYDQNSAGFSLSVKADRYFEDGGQRFVVSGFSRDPVNYTLMRLLETRGYRIIMLEDSDTFSKVAEKMLSRLRIPGAYAKQALWSSSDIPYSVQVSGIMMRNRQNPDLRLFVTDRQMSPLLRELVEFNGIDVQGN